MVINAYVKYRKKILIGVGDIHLEGQIFSNILSIWANKNGDKSDIFNLIRTNYTGFMGG